MNTSTNLARDLGSSAAGALQVERQQVQALEEAVSLLATSFTAEPLEGVGSAPWKALREAARTFSAAHAYRGADFPNLAEGASCVLCQQKLQSDDRKHHRSAADLHPQTV